MASLVLVHSPLTGPAAWGGLPDLLRDKGHAVAVVEVLDDDTPPYAARFVARAALQVVAATGDEPVVLVGHSGAGYLLPQLGAARQSSRRRVGGYVFLDAGLPRAGASRLDLLDAEDPEHAEQLRRLLAAGGRYPTWTDDDLADLVPDAAARAGLVASLRPRGQDFFTETLPFPGDWPDAPCALVRLSPAYDRAARLARSRGWPVAEVDPPGGHFAAVVAPGLVADALESVLPG